MRKFILLILGILFIGGILLTTYADDEFNGFYTCKYYMKGKTNDCIINVNDKKMVSPNCPFLTPTSMRTIITNRQKCTYSPITKPFETFACRYKNGECTIEVTEGTRYNIKCTPNITIQRAMQSLKDKECVNIK